MITGKHPAAGLTPCSLYNFIVSCCRVFESPLCLSLSLERCGFKSCIFFEALSWEAVRGYKIKRIIIVKIIIEKPKAKGKCTKINPLYTATKTLSIGQTRTVLKIE